MIACCGLDCSKCEAYLATQEDNDVKRAEVAKKWSVQYSEFIEVRLLIQLQEHVLKRQGLYKGAFVLGFPTRFEGFAFV